MRIASLSIAALMLATSPLVAQDFLAPLQDLVEDLVPQRQTPRPAPVAPEPVAPTPADERPEADEPEVDEEEPPLPRPRPEEAEEEEVLPEEPAELPDEAPSPASEPETEPVAEAEPDRVYQTACPALLSGVVVGEMLEPIAEGICGEQSPLSVIAVRVNGREIALSSPVSTNCEMAGAFADWVGEVDTYASAALDSPLAAVTTGTSFMCRNRVGAENGFVSEHGFANALDIVGFSLADGREVNVEADWMPAAAPEGRLLRQAHGAACGRFTTVLGPEANAEHEDHLHLDLGCHGQTCTARICD